MNEIMSSMYGHVCFDIAHANTVTQEASEDGTPRLTLWGRCGEEPAHVTGEALGVPWRVDVEIVENGRLSALALPRVTVEPYHAPLHEEARAVAAEIQRQLEWVEGGVFNPLRLAREQAIARILYVFRGLLEQLDPADLDRNWHWLTSRNTLLAPTEFCATIFDAVTAVHQSRKEPVEAKEQAEREARAVAEAARVERQKAWIDEVNTLVGQPLPCDEEGEGLEDDE